MRPSEKITKQLTVRGGINPYGQPDRKISVYFFDDFPYSTTVLHPFLTCYLHINV